MNSNLFTWKNQIFKMAIENVEKIEKCDTIIVEKVENCLGFFDEIL